MTRAGKAAGASERPASRLRRRRRGGPERRGPPARRLPRDLRHSFVSIALAAGLTLPEAAALALAREPPRHRLRLRRTNRHRPSRTPGQNSPQPSESEHDVSSPPDPSGRPRKLAVVNWLSTPTALRPTTPPARLLQTGDAHRRPTGSRYRSALLRVPSSRTRCTRRWCNGRRFSARWRVVSQMHAGRRTTPRSRSRASWVSSIYTSPSTRSTTSRRRSKSAPRFSRP